MEEKLPSGLYVVSTPIGNLGDVTLRALATLKAADVVACEDTRVTAKLLTAYGIKKPLLSYHDHNAENRQPEMLRRISEGQAVALVSDAGTPLVSDPGYKIVVACREAGLAVIAVPGANAMLTAMACCGLPSDRFCFGGFLPPKTSARRIELDAWKKLDATLVFHETPPRLAASLSDMAAVLGGQRQAAVARELTKLFEEVRRGTLAELSAHYASSPLPKGEIVVVIGRPEAAAESCGEDERASALKLLSERLPRLSVRDAVAEVAKITGMKRKEVYALALSETAKD